MTDHLVIIGGSYAAQQMAGSTRDGGFSGRITVLSAETIPPYQRPPLSKSYLLGKMEESRLSLVGPGYFDDRNIQLKLNAPVISVDIRERQVTLESGAVIDYNWLAFCTGARARRLNIPGADLPQVYTLRTLEDARRLRDVINHAKRVCIVGGGFIGLEAAAAFAQAGIETRVLEASDRLLSRSVPPVISDFMLSEHRKQGVQFELACTAQSIDEGPRSLRVATNTDTYDCDAVIAGVGALPNKELAEAAGVGCQRGIVTDRFGRTDIEGVLAAGDCAEFPAPFAPWPAQTLTLESIQATKDLAKAAATVINGAPVPFEATPWFWSDQYDLKLQMAGLLSPEDRIVLRGDPIERRFTAFGVRNGAIASAFSINRPADHMTARKLIGTRATVSEDRLSDPDFRLKSVFEN